MGKKIFLLAVCTCMLCTLCLAETIYLKNGKRIEGQITERTDTEVKINTLGVTLTYYTDEIERIEGETQQATTQDDMPQRYLPVEQTTTDTFSEEKSNTAIDSKGNSLAVDSALLSMSKKELILSYIETSGTKSNMAESLSQTISQGSPEDAQQLRELFNIDEIIELLVPVYDKYFTEDDLRMLLTFQNSDVGRKLQQVMPLIMQESMNALVAYVQQKAGQ